MSAAGGAGASLARRVVVLVVGLLAAALVAAGGIAAALVHARAGAATDAALAAAAEAYVVGGGVAWEVEHGGSDVRVWTARRGDPRVPEALARRAVDRERPVWGEVDGERLLLVVAEREHEALEDDEEHRIVAATAPAATWARSVGPFVAPYAAAAAAVLAAAAALAGRLARLALAPLDTARAAAERATASGARLPEDGPAEVRGLLAALNALLGRLDAAAAAQARFTAEAAHELRTPVTVLLGEIDVALRRERDAASLRATLASVREEAARLGELVEGLLALARVDAGQAERNREALDGSEVLGEAVRREAAGLEAAGCPLTVAVRSDGHVVAHRALLATALANLLRNAAVHAPGAPVRVAVEDGGARFVVEDGGPGIPEADRAAVFDRLARGGRARRADRGLGLGLPLAREIARRHGGDCVVGEGPGGGCRVELTIARG